MPVSTVKYGSETLLDLSGDSLSSAAQLLKGVTAHGRSGATLTGTAPKVISATSKSVAASAFTSDTTYADYPWRAAVAVSGVTASYRPYVEFSAADVAKGLLSADAQSYSGGVYIYASEKPTAAVTITKIECVEG